MQRGWNHSTRDDSWPAMAFGVVYPCPVPLSSAYHSELKMVRNCFVFTHLASVTPPPPVHPVPENWSEERLWPPRTPEPEQKCDIASGITGGAFWEIQTTDHSIMFNTNLSEIINKNKEKELLAVKNEPISSIYLARQSKNLGFPLLLPAK